MQTIALIAHDGKKDDMVRFARTHRERLATFHLIATGTTGTHVSPKPLAWPWNVCVAVPYGGDAQIAAKVAEGEVAAVIFLVDPLYAHPHEPDIQGLLRICNVYDVPLATNEVTATYILAGLTAENE